MPGDVASARQLAKEAMSINKSLSFLEQVVVALGARKGHVPHRSSKLTSVLRESLGGNCKTLLVANVWPEQRHMEETLSTLKFAARMQSVTNMAAINSQAEVCCALAPTKCPHALAPESRPPAPPLSATALTPVRRARGTGHAGGGARGLPGAARRPETRARDARSARGARAHQFQGYSTPLIRTASTQRGPP